MAYIKVYKYKKQISLDNGVTWQGVTPAEYVPSGDPIGTYDTLEECMAQYRTIQSGYTCVGVDKHNQDVYEVSYDNGVTWEVVSTSAGTLIETNSYDCGYRTRTTSGTAYCTGYDKYVDVYSQVSTDYGSTWTTTATTPTLIEANSPDCGYVPPTPASPKFVLTLNDSSTASAECDSSSAVTRNDVSVYKDTLVSAEIGDCVTEIGDYAFWNCKSLTSATIGNNVTSIGDYVFEYCKSLTSVEIPDGVTSIGYSAFRNCSGLTSIDIPDSVTSIDIAAFYNCSSLPTINIPSGVTGISSYAFYGCGGLTSITIPNNVTTIGNSAFINCSGLTSITVYATTPPTLALESQAFDDTNNCPIYVPCESVNTYKTAWSAYASRITCIKLTLILNNKTTVTMPSDSSSAVTRNDVSAYSASVVSAVIGGCVTSISTNAFKGCKYLANVNIPSGVTSIGNYAFSGCTGLTCVASMPSTPPALGTNVFASTNDCPIYVSNVVNAYKAASGWSEYSSRI